MVEQLKESQSLITRLAYIDINTKLPNRNYFHKLVTLALKEAAKANTKGAILFIDLNGFKRVNDSHGHKAGDELLALFAKRLMMHFLIWEDVKENDLWLNAESFPDIIPARLDDDEFVVLFKHVKNYSDVRKKIEALLSDIFGTYILRNYNNTNILLGSVDVLQNR